MPKKSSALKKFRKSATKKLLSNPMKWLPHDMIDVVPGLAAYTVSRLASRVAWKVAAQKRFGKHAAPLLGIGAFIAALVATKHRSLAKYRGPIIIGTGIAAVQTVLQTYLPQLGWIVSDWNAGQYQLGAGGSSTAMVPQGASFDDTAYYDETGDAGGGQDAPQSGPGPQGVTPPPPTDPSSEWVPDVGGGQVDDLDDLGSLAGGMGAN